jgi:hypothetical protein
VAEACGAFHLFRDCLEGLQERAAGPRIVGEHSAVVRPCATPAAQTDIVICNRAIKIPVLVVLAAAESSGRGKEGREISCMLRCPVMAAVAAIESELFDGFLRP